jgi:hypothetical protein
MSDDRTKKSQQHRKRIDVHHGYELSYWTKELGVPPDELKSVQKVGPRPRTTRTRTLNETQSCCRLGRPIGPNSPSASRASSF